MIWRHKNNKNGSTWLLLLLFLGSSSTTTANKEVYYKYCQVTDANGKDITDQLFVEDAEIPYVDCTGTARCTGLLITNCEKVVCSGTEACSHANIVDFTHSVTCKKTHACQYTTLTAAVAKEDLMEDRESSNSLAVTCQGTGACDVATIQAQSVLCLGAWSCHEATIKADVIKCTQGSSSTAAVACTGSCLLEANCLLCGTNGCADHDVNSCSYKPFPKGETWMDGAPGGQQSAACQSETLMGSCSNELQHQFDMDLHGKDDHDEKDGA
jgi:hypothetical protein